MGSYAEISLGGYNVAYTKNTVDPDVMTVFRESDKYFRLMRELDNGDLAEIADVPVENIDDNAIAELEEKQHLEVGYRAPAWLIRDRLDVMGFDLSHTKSYFEQKVGERILDLRTWPENSHEPSGWLSEELSLLETLSFDKWISSFQKIKKVGIESWHLVPSDENDPAKRLSPLQRYILQSDETYYGFPFGDFRWFLRASIEACEESESIVEDISALVSGGYYKLTDRIADDCRRELLADHPSNAAIIILTEGSSDSRFLSVALQVLYPHLSDCFFFLDFEALKVPGGAAYLVSTLKAFAAAGIANRVIALFDNDTAAREALRNFKHDLLPPNVRVLFLPDIPLGELYPTLGPAGPTESKINGLAGSIELYFGEDVLRQGNKTLTPVQWTSHCAALGSYQGELIEKVQLQKRFQKKIETALSNSSVVASQDWSGMRAIIDCLRTAFQTAT